MKPDPILELHGARTGNCLRAAVGLEEAGLSYVVRRIDLGQGEHRRPAHLSLNPVGKVPVLLRKADSEAGGFVLTQSNAIIFYAEEQAPGRLLPLAGTPARILALERFFFFVTDVIGLNGAAFALQREDHSASARILSDRSLSAIRTAERFVAQSNFMGGESFSMADIAAYTIINHARDHLPWRDLPRLDAWRHRIGARTAVVRGMSAFDPEP